MSDTELTELTGPEADHLRALLHRAADSLDVTTPDHVEIEPARRRPNPGRWLGAAAAVLVVAAIGAAWWLSGDDGQRIDTGPAEPPVTVAPRVRSESGIWRLPDDLNGYRLVSVHDSGTVEVAGAPPGAMAVDDPDDPQRWLFIEGVTRHEEFAPTTQRFDLPAGTTAWLTPADGFTWFQLERTDYGASGAAAGIDDETLIALLDEHASSPDGYGALLDDAGFGEDRLVWALGGPSPGADTRSLIVTLEDEDGAELVVNLANSSSPWWSQLLRLLMTAQSFPPETLTSQGIVRRSDLGDHIYEASLRVPGRNPISELVMIADDGTFISAGGASEAEYLPILTSLRAISEGEFRARLDELDAEFIEADQVPPDGTVTTIQGTPGG